MSQPYPKDFRDEVVLIARNRDPGVFLKDIAADFGITASCLRSWMRRAERDSGDEGGMLW